jgi:hypothetical protein
MGERRPERVDPMTTIPQRLARLEAEAVTLKDLRRIIFGCVAESIGPHPLAVLDKIIADRKAANERAESLRKEPAEGARTGDLADAIEALRLVTVDREFPQNATTETRNKMTWVHLIDYASAARRVLAAYDREKGKDSCKTTTPTPATAGIEDAGTTEGATAAPLSAANSQASATTAESERTKNLSTSHNPPSSAFEKALADVTEGYVLARNNLRYDAFDITKENVHKGLEAIEAVRVAAKDRVRELEGEVEAMRIDRDNWKVAHGCYARTETERDKWRDRATKELWANADLQEKLNEAATNLRRWLAAFASPNPEWPLGNTRAFLASITTPTGKDLPR